MSVDVMPLVSVIIPTHNRSRYVKRAVESVLNQTYKNIELIVVDDGSTDNTATELAVFRDRIIYIWTPHLGGSVGRVRNVGIKHSQGEYLAFLDSDDEWVPDKLELQMALLKNPEIHVVYCDAFYVDEVGSILSRQRERYRGDIIRPLLTRNIIGGSASAVLLKRLCLSKVAPFREELEAFEDWDMWLRLAFCFNFDYVPRPLVKIRVHMGNISNATSISAARLAIRNIYDCLLANRDTRMHLLRHWQACQSTVSYIVGYYYYHNGEIRMARNEFIKSIGLWLLQKRAYVALFITLPGGAALKSSIKYIRRFFCNIRTK